MNDIERSNAISALRESGKFDTRRKKLWELDSRLRCLVIGTCLTMEELRRLSRKAGISVSANMTDYELHRNFVQVAGNPVFAARTMNKWLDHKYDAIIRRLNFCTHVAELESLWDEMTRADNMVGAFLAVVTHALTAPALLQRVCGEAHTLSHFGDRSNHAAHGELAALMRRVAELEEALAWTASAMRLRVKEIERRDAAAHRLSARVSALERELAGPHERSIATLNSGRFDSIA